MFKFISICVLFSLTVLACSKKVVPDSTANTSKKTEESKKDAAEKTEDPVTNHDHLKGTAPAETPTTLPSQPPPALPKGPEKPDETESGKSIYTSKCNKCHATKNVKNYTFAQWESILKVMVPNAKLSPDEESALLSYIRANCK